MKKKAFFEGYGIISVDGRSKNVDHGVKICNKLQSSPEEVGLIARKVSRRVSGF